jgi:hypothetical protein
MTLAQDVTVVASMFAIISLPVKVEGFELSVSELRVVCSTFVLTDPNLLPVLFVVKGGGACGWPSVS